MSGQKTGSEMLQEWFRAACNGRWEHERGISIQTLDNPGWSLTVDLMGTALSGATMDPYTHEGSEDDWVFCKIESDQFKAYGDPSKLVWMIDYFCEWAKGSPLRGSVDRPV